MKRARRGSTGERTRRGCYSARTQCGVRAVWSFEKKLATTEAVIVLVAVGACLSFTDRSWGDFQTSLFWVGLGSVAVLLLLSSLRKERVRSET